MIQEETNTIVYSGPITLQHDGSAYPFSTEAVSSNTPVYEMDYTELSTPAPIAYGPRRRLQLFLYAYRRRLAECLSCLCTGAISSTQRDCLWRALLHISSASAYGKDTRPIYASTCTLFMSGNGVNCFNSDKDNFGNLALWKNRRTGRQCLGRIF